MMLSLPHCEAVEDRTLLRYSFDQQPTTNNLSTVAATKERPYLGDEGYSVIVVAINICNCADKGAKDLM